MQVPAIFLSALDVALNACLRLDPGILQRLAALSGKVIAVELRGLDLTLYLLPGTDGMQLSGVHEGAPDALLSGTPLALARLGAAKHEPGTLFSGDVEIRGDIELGQRFKSILDTIDIDWEEQLSKLTGDVIAHQVGNAVRDILDWSRRAADTMGRDAAEYLHEESRDLPKRDEVEEFLAGVDTLRSGVDRAEARIHRLHGLMQSRGAG